MQFFKDLTQAEPVYRDFPAKQSITLTNGGAMTLITTESLSYVDVQVTSWINTIGVYMGVTKTAGAGTIALGTSDMVKILVNPFACYLAEYDLSSSITATGFSAGAITATSEFQAGDWVLNNQVSGTQTANGLLLYIASHSTTASATAVTTSGYAGSVTPGATDKWTQIHSLLKGQLAGQYQRIDLNTAGTKIKSAASYTGVGIKLIDNHIRSQRSTALQPLRFATHNNTLDPTYKPFAEIMFVDNVWVKQTPIALKTS